VWYQRLGYGSTKGDRMRIVLVGNYRVDYTSETHHAKTLESMGHTVVRLQEGVASAEQILDESLKSDMLVFIHTHTWVTPGNMTISDIFRKLREKNIPTVTYHLDLWFGIERQKDLEEDDFYKSIEYFFTVDKLMADWFNEHTNVKGVYLQAAVFDQEVYKAPRRDFYYPVIFVGASVYHKEWPYRQKLIQYLANTFRGFRHIGPGGKIGVVRGQQLNLVYAESKVVVGDSLCLNFDYPYYWSDRVYETIGRGGFIIHPYIKGMEEHFEDKKHLVFYKFDDFEDLGNKIDYYLSHDEEREKIRQQGFEHVKANHTYKNRWEFIIKEVQNDNIDAK
jgi:glycosyltransferase involved in cell wall biosynthesis